MDIKDFILIGGGILITMVVGHGFWIAWRAKREPLRLDIVPDLIPDDVDEIERLRGELPNGGARVVTARKKEQAQENLELDLSAPVLMDPEPANGSKLTTSAADMPGQKMHSKPVEPALDTDEPSKTKPRVRQAPPRARTVVDAPSSAANQSDMAATAAVREVELHAEKPIVSATSRQVRRTRKGKDDAKHKTEEAASVTQAPIPQELLILNVLAAKGQRFAGEDLVSALRSQGLRYGEMNIFHRIDNASKVKVFSVANAVEPGTFDLSDLAALQSPGMTFFLQLPGPGEALDAFDDMLHAARNIALALGGDVRDEDLSVLTGQTVEHMRQRIADFARRRLSKRA